MAVNKPTGDNARKGAVKKRTKTTLGGASAWTSQQGVRRVHRAKAAAKEDEGGQKIQGRSR
jgi:hypothetical protein